MTWSLKNHPFGVVAELERTAVLAYAAPRAELSALLPPFLEPDTFKDDWGFVAVAIVRARSLRPSGFPTWLGNDLWLIGYRIFVRYVNAKGRRLRGLYILGSETNERRMVFLGNLFTHYRYVFKPMDTTLEAGLTALRSSDGTTVVSLSEEGSAVPLPGTSVFADWTEARRFIGPLPFTFSHDVRNGRVLIVEGVRTDWHPRPVRVGQQAFAFLHDLGLSELRLSNAFVIDRVPYRWKAGVLEDMRR